MTDMEKWEKDMIAKQPVFDDKESAVQYALGKYDEGNDLPEIFRNPDNGKYVVANYRAFELLLRKGYEMIVDLSDMMNMHQSLHQGG